MITTSSVNYDTMLFSRQAPPVERFAYPSQKIRLFTNESSYIHLITSSITISYLLAMFYIFFLQKYYGV